MDYRLVETEEVLHSVIYKQIEFKAGISVRQDWSASGKDSYNNKLSYNSEENPKLGHNHRYVKCLRKESLV